LDGQRDAQERRGSRSVIVLLLHHHNRPLKSVHALRVVLLLRLESFIILGALFRGRLAVSFRRLDKGLETGNRIAKARHVAGQSANLGREGLDAAGALGDRAVQAGLLFFAPSSELGVSNFLVLLFLLGLRIHV